MTKANKRLPASGAALAKTPTGIAGLDEITGGGLPKGRPTLICGSAGCGKTLLGMEFLVRGALQYDEPGVFMAFEETGDELTQNVASLGFDLRQLVAQNKIALDYVHIERSEIEETGEYDLEGLFIRLGYAIDSIGAKRVVLDSIEALFSGLSNTSVLRAELRRLLRWLKTKGVTAVVTAERGDGALTRSGLEEYVADCVILLDNRVIDQISTRRLRVVKYRGSKHGANEYPFFIGAQGMAVLPITSIGLDHTVSAGRISTGVPRIDTMLGGQGYYRGSSVLISGTAGSGKSSLAAAFAAAACQRGERCLYFAFEESPSQIMRNMRSIGIDLEPWLGQGLLQFQAARSTTYGLEVHLAMMHDAIRAFAPGAVVIDPISNLIAVGNTNEVKSTLTRLIDFLKAQQVTAVFTSLTAGDSSPEQTEAGISSLMDSWLLLRNLESYGERNRGLYILKSRGMAHSNQIRELVLSDGGIELTDVYIGAGEVLTGAARLAQEARAQAEELARRQESERRQRGLERKRAIIESQIVALRAELEAEQAEQSQRLDQQQLLEQSTIQEQADLGRKRMADVDLLPHQNGNKRK
jgi:circadian clock protein KaiC